MQWKAFLFVIFLFPTWTRTSGSASQRCTPGQRFPCAATTFQLKRTLISGLTCKESSSDEYSSHWKYWLADLLNLSAFTVSHCLKPAGFGQVRSSQLHPFSDASEAAYGSASYLPLVNDEGKIHCSFLFSKSRVAPLKTVSIPLLELSAATVSVRQDRMLKRELDMPLNVVSVF